MHHLRFASFIGNFKFNRHISREHHEIQCHETPHQKEVEYLAKVTQNMLEYMGFEPHYIPILVVKVQRLGDIK